MFLFGYLAGRYKKLGMWLWGFYMFVFWPTCLIFWIIVISIFARLRQPEPQPITTVPGVAQWSNEINQASQKYGVDSALIAGIMTVESGGKIDAISSSGARGLMQIMLQYAGIDMCPTANLWNPVENIDCGTKYLAWLLNETGGDQDVTIMSYHGGLANGRDPRSVDKGYLVSVKAAMSRSVGTFDYPNPVAAMYRGAGFSRTGTKGTHDNGARDYQSDQMTLYAPIHGRVTANSVDGLGNTYIRITNDTERILLMHGVYNVSVGDAVQAGVTVVGTSASIGDSSHRHEHIQYLVNGVAQQLP